MEWRLSPPWRVAAYAAANLLCLAIALSGTCCDDQSAHGHGMCRDKDHFVSEFMQPMYRYRKERDGRDREARPPGYSSGRSGRSDRDRGYDDRDRDRRRY